MFGKASLLALVLPLVHALQLSTPTGVASGGTVTLTWTPAAGDPAVFSVYLFNPAFHDSFGLANNVQSAAGTLTIQLPIVPASDGYTFRAVEISNVNNVYSSSSAFSISGTITSPTVSAPTGTATTPLVPPTGLTSSAAVPTASSASGTSPGAAGASARPSTGAASPMSFGFTASNAGSFAAVLLCAVAGVFAVAM